MNEIIAISCCVCVFYFLIFSSYLICIFHRLILFFQLRVFFFLSFFLSFSCVFYVYNVLLVSFFYFLYDVLFVFDGILTVCGRNATLKTSNQNGTVDFLFFFFVIIFRKSLLRCFVCLFAVVFAVSALSLSLGFVCLSVRYSLFCFVLFVYTHISFPLRLV